MSDFHILNIVTHVTAGSFAIIAGLILLSRPKGTGWHRMAGWITLAFAGICVGAALIGAFLFRGRIDLMGVSVLTAYQIWSGLRSLRLKSRGRGLIDLVPAIGVLSLGIAVLWLYRNGTGNYNWSPGLVYASIGGLIFYGGWDVLRTLFPLSWRRVLNPAEHGYKLTSLIGALVSVAFGTVLKAYSVSAPLIASAVFAVLGLMLAIRAARKAVGVTPSTALNARLKTDSDT